jgi:DNA-binding NarL/FixJ family response regulator
MIRVMLVDDQQLVRAGLRMLCESAPDMEVVGEASDGAAAVRLAEELRPDVILMDLRMPGVNGIIATGRILQQRPSTRIVVLTTFDDDEHLYPALGAGACGFLVKDATPGELLDGIRRAAAGDSPFSKAVLRRLVEHAVRSQAAAPVAPQRELPRGVTEREAEVLELVGQGLSNPEIAERLHLGVTTVKTHVASLMAKTGSANRVQLAVYAAKGRK